MYPSIIIQIDDSSADMYNKFYPILKDRGLIGSLALRTSVIGQANQITDAQVTEMYNNGWSISNHTNQDDQLPTLTQEQIETAVQSTIDYFQVRGWVGSEYDLVVPQDRVDDYVLNIVSPLVRTCDFNSDNYGWNAPTTVDKYRIRRRPSTNQLLSTIKANVDTAITNGTNVVIFFHKIAADTTDLFYSETDFIEFADYVQQKVRNDDIACIGYREYCDFLSTTNVSVKGIIS